MILLAAEISRGREQTRAGGAAVSRMLRPGSMHCSIERLLLVAASSICAACGAPPKAGQPTPSHPRLGTFLFRTAGPAGPDQPAFRAALAEFNLYTLPVFLLLIQAERGQFDFSLPDAV